MSDALLETFLHYGTNAQRVAFTPDPPIVSGVAVKVLYEWRETDTGDVYVYDTSWHLISSGTATAITSLTGDVAGTGPGATATTIANNAVTLAKIAHAAASSKLVGSGSAGSGANYSELSLGSGLSMSGTTLSATGSGGTVTNTGTLTSGKNIIGNGTVDVTVSSLTANLLSSASGTIAGATAAANDKLVGSGNSGSGAAYAEISLGSGLTMTGTTLSASGAAGTVTTTGSPASGNLTKFTGASSISNADLTGDVTTSGTVATTIANSAVTLAKIANAAASSKLVGSGASGSGAAYTELTLGTNLSMSGTTLNATGGTAGALILLEQHAVTGTAVNFTSAISSTYDTYVFELVNVIPTADDSINVRFSTNGGSSWLGSGYYYGATSQTNSGGPTGGTGNADTKFQLAVNVDHTLEGISGTFSLYGPQNGSLRRTASWNLIVATTTTIGGNIGWGVNTGTTAINAVQFIPNTNGTNTFAAGNIRCYGVAK